MIVVTQIEQQVNLTVDETTEVINIEVTETIHPTYFIATQAPPPETIQPITPYTATFIFDETPQTVPNGFTGIIVNLNNVYADVTFTVSGTELTVTGGADSGEKLLINGKY
jgi:hypothetical protein